MYRLFSCFVSTMPFALRNSCQTYWCPRYLQWLRIVLGHCNCMLIKSALPSILYWYIGVTPKPWPVKRLCHCVFWKWQRCLQILFLNRKEKKTTTKIDFLKLSRRYETAVCHDNLVWLLDCHEQVDDCVILVPAPMITVALKKQCTKIVVFFVTRYQ